MNASPSRRSTSKGNNSSSPALCFVRTIVAPAFPVTRTVNRIGSHCQDQFVAATNVATGGGASSWERSAAAPIVRAIKGTAARTRIAAA
ncbi:MAG: hypothetical protein JNL12_07905 [Planctomycetes bacterium]|nr:hypothetical protein [Planctomycetota bacterium]